jgi:hypothetical protein
VAQPADPFAATQAPLDVIHAAATTLAAADHLTLDRDGVHALSLLLRVTAWQVESNPFAAVEALAVARAVLGEAAR